MKRYGLPYKGSKNRIAEQLISRLPEGDTFVDLFAGGCAMTHVALLSGKYRRFIANDIAGTTALFLDAVSGKYAHETRWISREEFHKLKATDPYVRLLWSFGNNGRTYLYSMEVEPWKKALHYARVLGDVSLFRDMGIESDGSREDVMAHHDEYKTKYIAWYLVETDNVGLRRKLEAAKQKVADESEKLRQYLLDALKDCGLTQSEVQRRLGTQMSCHYFGRSQWAFPTREYYEQMQTFMPKLSQPYNDVVGLMQYWQSLEILESLESLQSLQRLQRLESMQRLQSLESLERLERLQSLEILESLESLQSLESMQSLESLQRLERLQRLESMQSLERQERLQSMQSLERQESLQRLQSLQILESLQSMQSLQRLQRLQSLQSLEMLQRLETYALDYADVQIPQGAVVYADPPYKGTDIYNGQEFDHDRFYQWLRTVPFPVYVSEYAMPADFIQVAEVEHSQKLNGKGSTKTKERLYLHERWADSLYNVGLFKNA